MRKLSFTFYVILLIFSVATACGRGIQTNVSESSNPCNPGSQSNEFIKSPGGLLISAEFESIDVNFSEPILFTVFTQNSTHLIIRESITIRLSGYHLPKPFVATFAAHEPIAEYPISLEVQPGETICYNFIVDMDTYLEIGTGNYNLYFVEAEDHLAHMNLSGALEIVIIAPETIGIDQDLDYQVEVHNPTPHIVYDISVNELHRQIEEFIPALLPRETVTFSHTVYSSKYQNTNMTGITVLTETPEYGADMASKIIEVEGFFEE